MTNDEIASLKNDIAILNQKVAELYERTSDTSKALRSLSTGITEHFGKIYRYIADIHDYLMPILHKVFPNYEAAKKQIDAFMEQYGVPNDAKKNR